MLKVSRARGVGESVWVNYVRVSKTREAILAQSEQWINALKGRGKGQAAQCSSGMDCDSHQDRGRTHTKLSPKHNPAPHGTGCSHIFKYSALKKNQNGSQW